MTDTEVRRAREPDLVKITTRINAEDRDTLQQFFPQYSYQEILRRILGKYCRRLRERASQGLTIEKLEEPNEING